jgi:hypothetical protein
MVQHGDFKIELVYADTKMPFKEHIKDGKIYVEVEPDVEYFISIQQTGASRGGTTIMQYFVDEQFLGYQDTYPYLQCEQVPFYGGVCTMTNSVSIMTALKFTKPRISADGTNVKRGLLMGKVEVDMYDGTSDGFEEDQRSNFSSSFSAVDLDLDLDQDQSGYAKKKSLRSGEGETTVSDNCSGKMSTYKLGALLDTVTLNYCAAPGLIEVGVLEKPGAWTHHRMKRPAELDQGAPRVRPKRIPDPGISGPKTVELFDLSAVGSDDEGALLDTATFNSGPKTVELFDLSVVGVDDEGALLDTASLNDCAAPELTEVGVLEKPDAGMYHRMKRPAEPDRGAPRVRPKTTPGPGVADPKTDEPFDVFAIGSETSDDDDEEDEV